VNIFGTARNRWENRDFFGSDGYTTNSFGDSMLGQLPEKVRENQPKPPSSQGIASTEDVHRGGFGTAPEEPARIDRASGESKKARRRASIARC
jgi:hypothetical protein